MPVLPLAFAGFGWLAADRWRGWRGAGRRVALAAALVALVLWPLVPLQTYLARGAADGQVDLDLIQLAATISLARRSDELILLDESLGRRGLPRMATCCKTCGFSLNTAAHPIASARSRRARSTASWLARARRSWRWRSRQRELDERFRFIPLEEHSAGRYQFTGLERR